MVTTFFRRQVVVDSVVTQRSLLVPLYQYREFWKVSERKQDSYFRVDGVVLNIVRNPNIIGKYMEYEVGLTKRELRSLYEESGREKRKEYR